MLFMLSETDAEAAANRMIDEAFRYDTAQQTRIAEEILEHIAVERGSGLEHGAVVRLLGLAKRPELNGKEAIVRGKHRGSDRYYVDVGASRFLVRRMHLVIPDPVGLFAADADSNLSAAV